MTAKLNVLKLDKNNNKEIIISEVLTLSDIYVNYVMSYAASRMGGTYHAFLLSSFYKEGAFSDSFRRKKTYFRVSARVFRGLCVCTGNKLPTLRLFLRQESFTILTNVHLKLSNWDRPPLNSLCVCFRTLRSYFLTNSLRVQQEHSFIVIR